jgi:AraC-like DNA-binding protein
MDTLSRVLDSLHFNGAFYFATNFYAPWSVEVPVYKNAARFHYVTQGSCWVRIEGWADPQQLFSGDIIVIPHGARHILSDTSDRPPISLDEAFAQESYDGQGIFQIGEGISPYATQLVCGHFEFIERFKHPLMTHLPHCIIKRESDGIDFSWSRDTLRFLSHTATMQYDGSSAIIKRLSEVIFIQVVRFWNQSNGVKKGFIAALDDKQLSNGLKAFHDNYADEWTVEKLASESGMSRSLFSERFKQYLDMPPMQYVTNWRMQTAKQMLIETDLPLDAIATEVGYESAAAFSKAFKRLFEQTPGEYKRLANHLETQTVDKQ